jgi:hypothetical protein
MGAIKKLIKLKIEYYNKLYSYLSNSKFLSYVNILEELLDEIEGIPETVIRYEEIMEDLKND